MAAMNFSKYFKVKNYNIGGIMSLLIRELYNKNKYNNILIVRSYTTGPFLDDLLLKNQDIDRIVYYTDKTNEGPFFSLKTPLEFPAKGQSEKKTFIHSDDLENQLILLNKKYDLICMDTWHEYREACRDFKLISSLLSETGILISHDCYPWNKTVANPSYIEGAWSGETYISFIELAYNNPDMFYGVLNVDTGIGILSKQQLYFLSNKLDRTKQEHLLLLHKNSGDAYTYFSKNSKDIINAVKF